MAAPNTFDDNTLLRQALYDLLANDTELFNWISQAVVNASEWLTGSWTPSYLAADSFSLPGDQRGAYLPGRGVRAHLAGGYVYAHAAGAEFDPDAGETVITLSAGVLDESLDETALGIISPGVGSALPAQGPTISDLVYREMFS
ncbi:hypothetical protein AAU61_14450 [Desulfocarbo indianensis]|nr:hypothetical protein AAU61_14450 [Desulfocarbo indianensis]